MSDEMRDIGPYADSNQAWQQYRNWSRGMPDEIPFRSRMMVREALMIAGIEPTDFEMDYLVDRDPDPLLSTILHGWILRAHLRGVTRPKPERT